MHVGGLRLLAGVLGLGTANYPENLHKAYIINVPSFFAAAWRLIRCVRASVWQHIITAQPRACHLFHGRRPGQRDEKNEAEP
eukprot:COSAG01_NODE_119_length_25410_cov_1333.312275_36_plen_82_part_00